MDEELRGYCLNNAEHYGRLCECGACHACCACGRKERRLAALKARTESAHRALDAICIEAIATAKERGARVNDNPIMTGGVRVRVDSSRQYGPHIRIQGWGRKAQMIRAGASIERVVDVIVDEYRLGQAVFNNRKVGKQ